MAKQALLYEEVVPVTKERHGGWSIEQGKNFAFAQTLHSVPLMFSEFQHAAVEMPIVFGKANDAHTPLAMMGMQPERSLFVDAEGGFRGGYCPAFLRRYPFVFARGPEDAERYALCIDETYPGCDPKGKTGSALFTEDGETSPYLNRAMEYAKSYEVDQRKTTALMAIFDELGLFDPMQATVALADGKKIALTGFFVISQERFRKLPTDKVQDLFERQALDLIYYHFASMRTLERLRNMVT